MKLNILCVLLFLCLSPVTVLAGETPKKRPTLPSAAELAKLPPDGGPKWNRLVFEKSPYLQQHAANPVDWRPWGEAAFKAAREQDKPIFLSIGYATCHWCHVMEHESFEDPEVAALMNTNFICVKVDREERPDVDDVYMTACQAMTGSGGWPLTAILTPDLDPFYVGTYFPKTGRFGRPGMMELIPKLANFWNTKRDEVIKSAGEVTSRLQAFKPKPSGKTLDAAVLNRAYEDLAKSYDAENGGFGKAPKFLTPHRFEFLLRHWKRTGDAKALEMVTHSLKKMRAGGVYDQIGFGFHRYATDDTWLTPHFEKMLYDQALTIMLFLETYQASGDVFFANVAREMLTYLETRMMTPEGGFHSAEDADSEGEEGKFYVWEPGELVSLLGQETAAVVMKVYDVVEGGNYLDEASGEKTGGSILHLKQPIAEVAAKLEMSEPQLKTLLESARSKLLSHRNKRVHPFRDDKILTDWNGLTVSAFARAGAVLNEPRYTAAAQKTADYLLKVLRDKDGRLLKRARGGSAGLTAHLDDYAFLSAGLLDLYEANFQLKYLSAAIDLTDIMLRDFRDPSGGGFFLTGNHAEKLILRSKKVYDGALPSGNSVAALSLLRLGRMTARSDYEEHAAEIFTVFADNVSKYPSRFTALLKALDFAVGPSFEIVIAGKAGAADVTAMAGRLHQAWLPNRVILFRPDAEPAPLAKIAAYTEGQVSHDGRATAYVCRNFACKKPTTRIDEMINNLRVE